LTKAAGGQPPAEEKPKETKPAESSVKAEVKEARPQVKEAPPPAKPIKAEKSPPAPGAGTAEGKENGSGWTVQVNAFPDERSAKIWVDRLKNKGYNAYVAEVDVRGKTWYRVRVGNYRTREEAKKVEDMLKNKENYSKAFTASR
jgi:DedD protein